MADAVLIRRIKAFTSKCLRTWFRIPEYPSCPFFCLYPGRTRPMFTPTQRERMTREPKELHFVKHLWREEEACRAAIESGRRPSVRPWQRR